MENLDQVKEVHADVIWTLNEITARTPETVGVHNVNKGGLHEPELDYFIQIQHDGSYHGQYDDIKDIVHINQTKGKLTPWEISKMAVWVWF